MTGSELRDLRKQMGDTQASLAARMRLSESGVKTISEWERGKRSIPASMALLIEMLSRE